MIQNGANSGVGLYVIQLARHFGFRTINVIRNRPNFQEAVDRSARSEHWIAKS